MLKRTDANAAERELQDMIVDTEAECGEDYNLGDLIDSLAVEFTPAVIRQLRTRYL